MKEHYNAPSKSGKLSNFKNSMSTCCFGELAGNFSRLVGCSAPKRWNVKCCIATWRVSTPYPFALLRGKCFAMFWSQHLLAELDIQGLSLVYDHSTSLA